MQDQYNKIEDEEQNQLKQTV